MWLDEYAPVLAVADTTRPILLIAFIVGLFGLAGLGVVVGRKRASAQNARAFSDDAGLAKASTKGGDGTFSAEWAAEVRDEVDDVPRQSWSDVLTMQGIAATPEVAGFPFTTTDATASPDPTPVYEQPVYEQPVYEQPVYAQPVYEQPVYEQPVYEQPVAPVYAQPVYEEPAVPTHEHPAATDAVMPTAAEPTAPVSLGQPPHASPSEPSLPGGQYAAYFGAVPPPPPPPPSSEPLNIWDADTDEH